MISHPEADSHPQHRIKSLVREYSTYSSTETCWSDFSSYNVKILYKPLSIQSMRSNVDTSRSVSPSDSGIME